MHDRKQRCLPFLSKYFKSVWKISSKDLFLCGFEQKECSHTGMTVADYIFLLAGLENSPSLKLISEQLEWQEEVETGTGKPVCERSACWWLNLICAVSAELSELEIKDRVVSMKGCPLCVCSFYTSFCDQLLSLGKCTQENRVLPFKYYSASSLIERFILVNRSCRQKLPQMKLVCCNDVFWIKDNMRFHTLCTFVLFCFVLKFRLEKEPEVGFDFFHPSFLM